MDPQNPMADATHSGLMNLFRLLTRRSRCASTPGWMIAILSGFLN
jgi:hypothetical protein